MKKVLLFFTALIFLINCSSRNKTENNTIENKTGDMPAVSQNNSNTTNVPNSASTIKTGETVTNAAEVSFQPEGLPPGWQWLDPDGKNNPTRYSTKSGVLHIDIPTGKDLYEDTSTAPRLLKTVTGDFEIETRLKFDPQDSYQGAGLLIFRNDSNYMRLERSFGGLGTDKSGIRFDVREDESFEPVATPENFPTAAKTVELKIRRAGREFTAFWRGPGAEWKEVAKYKLNYPAAIQVGIIACNTAEEIPVEFSYIKLGPPSK